MLSDADIICDGIKHGRHDAATARKDNWLVKSDASFLEQLLDFRNWFKSVFSRQQRWHGQVDCAWNIATRESSCRSCINDLRLHLTWCDSLNIFVGSYQLGSKLKVKVGSAAFIWLAALGWSIAPGLKTTVQNFHVVEAPCFENKHSTCCPLIIASIIANDLFVETHSKSSKVLVNEGFLWHHEIIRTFSVSEVG